MKLQNVKRMCVVILIVLAILTAGCVKVPKIKDGFADVVISNTAQAMDETDIVGEITLPPESQKAGWVFEDNDDTLQLTAYYEDITLTQAMDFLSGLSSNGWYLTGNGAYKSPRSVDMYYSFDTQSMQMDFMLEKGDAEWPDGTLTPYLAYAAPAFPFGTYLRSEKDSTGRAVTLEYEGVSFAEVAYYLSMLEYEGYTAGEDYTFIKGTNYIKYDYSEQTAYITVGMLDVQMVPLPPWPEALTEQLVRILPPMAAVISVTGAEGGFFALAEKTTLSELHSFITSAQEYGWSALNERDEINHAESGYILRILSYDSESETLTLVIWNNDGGEPEIMPTESAADTERPSEAAEQGGETGYRYTVTQEAYNDHQAMLGVIDEFGDEAEMADWYEIKTMYGNDIAGFLDRAGVRVNEDVWVQWDGSRYFGPRHFFLAWVSGGKREDFLIHDQVGDEAWLGSWYDIDLRVLVKVPIT